MLASALGAAQEAAPAGAVEGTLAADGVAKKGYTEAVAYDSEECSVDIDMAGLEVEGHSEPFVAAAESELEVLRLGP